MMQLPDWPLRVDPTGRYLMDAKESPWFWLGDTAWELFHRLTPEQASEYLQARCNQEFNVIQAVALAELEGLDVPTPHGLLPFRDRDPRRPNDAYFDHVRSVVDLANSMGLVMAVLPTWGCYLTKQYPKDEVIFTPESMAFYGRYLADRLRGCRIVWMLGGDRRPDGVEHLWRVLGNTLKTSDPQTLITWHTNGGPHTSAHYWPNEPWLDFHGFQSSHGRRFCPNWRHVAEAWNTTPHKPVLELEPCYEQHPIGFYPPNGRFNAYEVRFVCYQSVFAGGCGVTYGATETWGMAEPGREYPWGSLPTCDWRKALNHEGACQMRHLRTLIESRPAKGRGPDQSRVLAGGGSDADRVAVCRDGFSGSDNDIRTSITSQQRATWLMAYVPCVQKWITLDLSCFEGAALLAWRMNPRTGQVGELTAPTTHEWTIPWPQEQDARAMDGSDWVIVVDRADAGYAPPCSSVI